MDPDIDMGIDETEDNLVKEEIIAVNGYKQNGDGEENDTVIGMNLTAQSEGNLRQ